MEEFIIASHPLLLLLVDTDSIAHLTITIALMHQMDQLADAKLDVEEMDVNSLLAFLITIITLFVLQPTLHADNHQLESAGHHTVLAWTDTGETIATNLMIAKL